jgi:outer membrane protein assembly factor BamB
MLRISLLLGLLLAGLCFEGRADEWPQWRGPNRDGVWSETGLIQRFPGETIKRKWSVPIASGYSGPTVAEGKVYVTDRVTDPEQQERVHCFDFETGQQVWSYSYPREYVDVGYTAGPRACVTVDSGRAFALGTMGDLHCFEAAAGKLLWKRDLLADYRIRMPIWGIASAPLVHQDLVILQVGGAEKCLVALDAATGTERWSALTDRASYSAPILIQQAGQTVLVCWTGDSVAGLDPITGKVHWRHPFEPTRMVIATATPVLHENHLFVTSFYDGSLLLKVNPEELNVEPVWRILGPSETRTEALHSMISTPFLQGEEIYGFDSYGEFRCLDLLTGERLWENLEIVPRARWSTVHTVRNGEDLWMFNERGELLRGQVSRAGFREFTRAKLIEPTQDQLRQRGGVCWAHPAYAYKHVFARSDKELVCASLSAE